jgi:SAM-dependent MidA family methyltransferase
MSRRDGSDPLAGSSDDSLAARLRERIRLEGPLTFRDWMAAALHDEREGYYRRRGLERWGRAGDYRTAPERTRLFAATFARHFARLYEELGSPPVLHLVEAGGGAGRFALVVLETLRRDEPRLFKALRYVFDEPSADSRARADALLSDFADHVEFKSAGDFERPLDYALVFSNELLDALPVHRVRLRGGELREEYVATDSGGAFIFVEGEPSTPLLAEHFRRAGVRLAEGQAAEVNLEAARWTARAARLVGRGFLVTVDYGDEAASLYGDPRRLEGTLRAFRGHEFAADVLADPGRQDLTTTVNWTHVASAGEAAGLTTVSLERLDAFLLRAGLLEQLERESAHASGDAETAALRLEAREMILPGGMASHFQVLIQKKAEARP